MQEHFSSQSPEKTAAQLKRQREELLKNLPQGNQVNDQMLAIATSMQMVRHYAMLTMPVGGRRVCGEEFIRLLACSDDRIQNPCTQSARLRAPRHCHPALCGIP